MKKTHDEPPIIANFIDNDDTQLARETRKLLQEMMAEIEPQVEITTKELQGIIREFNSLIKALQTLSPRERAIYDKLQAQGIPMFESLQFTKLIAPVNKYLPAELQNKKYYTQDGKHRNIYELIRDEQDSPTPDNKKPLWKQAIEAATSTAETGTKHTRLNPDTYYIPVAMLFSVKEGYFFNDALIRASKNQGQGEILLPLQEQKPEIMVHPLTADGKRDLKRPTILTVIEAAERPLKPFDFYVLWAAYSILFKLNTPTFSLMDLWHAMGYTTNPNQKQRTALLNSLWTMKKTLVQINAVYEKIDGYKIKNGVITGSVIDFYTVDGVEEHGQPVMLVHLQGTSPIVEYTELKKQITSVGIEVMRRTEKNLTDRNITIMFFLLTWITRLQNEKNGGKNPNFLYWETILDYCHIKQADAKRRAKDFIAERLNYYKSIGFITSYKIDEKGTTGKTGVKINAKKRTAANSQNKGLSTKKGKNTPR